MSEVFFFFSAGDPSIPSEAISQGNLLLVNKRYKSNEELIVISKNTNENIDLFRRFYVLPSRTFVGEISMDDKIADDSDRERYIMQRIGAAAIDLILYKNPSSAIEVCVGSLGYHSRTYRSLSEPLEPRPPAFASAFKSLSSFIKRSATPVSNRLSPKTVYVFPEAMALLRQDFLRSPWPSLEMEDQQ